MGAPSIYHERQIRELCALHALNNLFQAKDSFSKALLDDICKQLSPDVWINPHRSVLGLGNYDVNVLMSALQQKQCEAIWFDKRKDPSCIETNGVIGYILNVPTEYKLGFVVLPLRRRHWIALKKIDGKFWNLDSKMDSPSCIGDEPQFMDYLRNHLQSNDKELFIIVQKDIEQTQSWLKNDT